MDAGFYRGTNADQDNRFSDKEKKLLKQMKFEPVLETKVDMSKVNIEVIKPWITCKLNDILGIEDDVVIEYVFTQLEDQKIINPKVMQINLTGFLNARRSREFMAELWQMFIEAESSPDGIPKAIVEKKMKELKATNTGNPIKSEGQGDRPRENDWQHRYQSLTGGRYGKVEPNFSSERDNQRDRSPVPARRNDRDNRDDRRVRDRSRDRGRNSRDRDVYRRRRSRTRSPPLPPRRRFTEKPSGTLNNSDGEAEVKDSNDERMSNGSETHKKKKKRKHRHHSGSEPDNDGDDSGAERKKAKKHKKEKKKKHKKDRD